MIDIISTLVDLCKLAKIAGKVVGAVASGALSPPQKELLAAAAETGEFYVIETEQLIYPIIRAGDCSMGNENDPASLAKYLDAFKKLCESGYVESFGGKLFRLTAGGFDAARALLD